MTTKNHVSNFFKIMGILNFLELEAENQQIILHNEGLFVKAYERSAYLLVLPRMLWIKT